MDSCILKESKKKNPKQKDPNQKIMALCNRKKERICARKGKDLSVVKKGKERDA